MSQSKGIVEILMDFSFEEFVTLRIVKFLYVIGLIGCVLWGGSVLIAGLATKKLFGILAGLIGAPLAFALGALLLRVYMELILVLFRIAENTQRMVKAVEKKD